MTWDEFKAVVDAHLAAQGVSGAIEIWYIDVSSDILDEVTVSVEPIGKPKEDGSQDVWMAVS